jgi:hypothetical protein
LSVQACWAVVRQPGGSLALPHNGSVERCWDTTCALTRWLLCSQNVILAVCEAVVHDPSPWALRDLSASSTSPEDAWAHLRRLPGFRLQGLNVAVAVTSSPPEISMDELSQFQVRASSGCRPTTCTTLFNCRRAAWQRACNHPPLRGTVSYIMGPAHQTVVGIS